MEEGIQIRNKVTQNSQLKTLQVMGIKGLKIPIMPVPKGLHMLQRQLDRLVMHRLHRLSQQLLKQTMISQPSNQVLTELLQVVHQLLMVKLCLLSLVIRNMTPRRCMLLPGRFVVACSYQISICSL